MAITVNSSPAEIVYTKNAVQLSIQSSLDEAFVTIEVEVSHSVVVAGTISGNLVKNTAVIFDVAEILDAWSAHSLPGNSSIKIAHPVAGSNWLQYRITIKEYTPAGVLQSTTELGQTTPGDYELRAVKGGLSIEKAGASKHFNTNKFLTYQSNVRTLPEQHFWLDYWYDPAAPTQFVFLKAKLYFTDGTNETITIDSYEDPPVNCILRVYAGFNGNDLHLVDLNKVVAYYDIILNDGTDDLVSFRFYVDWEFYRTKRFFLYANSAGGIDVFSTTGNLKHSIQGAADQAEVPSESGKNLISFAHSLSRSGEVGSGYRPQAEIELLSDILLSDFRYVLMGTSWAKILLTDPAFEYNEPSNLFALVFKYQFSGVNRNFTPSSHA